MNLYSEQMVATETKHKNKYNTKHSI